MIKITLTIGKLSINDNIDIKDLNKKININKVCIIKNDDILTKIKNIRDIDDKDIKMTRYKKLSFDTEFFENLTSAYDFAIKIGGGSENDVNFIFISDDIFAIITKLRLESIAKYKIGKINEKVAKYAQWLYYWCGICKQLYGKRAFIYAEIKY